MASNQMNILNPGKQALFLYFYSPKATKLYIYQDNNVYFYKKWLFQHKSLISIGFTLQGSMLYRFILIKINDGTQLYNLKCRLSALLRTLHKT